MRLRRSSRRPRAAGATGVATGTSPSVVFSEPVAVDPGAFAIACATSGAHPLAASGGPTTFSLDPAADFSPGESCTLTVAAASVHDLDGDDPPDTMAADVGSSFRVSPPVTPTPIHAIQGAAHVSPLVEQNVVTTGIVTAVRPNGFFLQDPSPDADPATSEAIFVFGGAAAAAVAVGEAVQVGGRVSEFRADTVGLTTTELGSPLTISVLSSGNPLPASTLVGPGGRVPPGEVIEDDATGNVETSGTFDPAQDGLDFWESLEDMRVEIDDAVAVGPTNSFGETEVVSNGAASIRTPRGGVIARPTDFNPERVVVDDLLVPLPAMNVGDHYTSPVVGVLDYAFDTYVIEATQAPTVVHDGVRPESTSAATANQLAVATFNVENLAPSDPASKYSRLATIVVASLRSPDLIAVEEVQDNSGATDDGVVAADVTLGRLAPPSRRPAARTTTTARSTRSTTRTAASRAATSGSCSCSAPTAASASSTRRAAARRPPTASPPAATCASARAGSIPRARPGRRVASRWPASSPGTGAS